MGILDFLKINIMKNKKDVNGLIEILKHSKNKSAKSRAAQVLGEIGDEKAVIPLTAALHEKGYGISESAAYALGMIGDTRALIALNYIVDKAEGAIRAMEWMRESIGYSELFDKPFKGEKGVDIDLLKAARWAMNAIKIKRWKNILKNNRDFLEQCEKFIVLGAGKEIQRLSKEIKEEESISYTIHQKIRKDINKNIKKNKKFLENGKNLLKNLYRRKSIYSELKSQLDDQILIITNIKKYAKKIEDLLRKKEANDAILLLEKNKNLSEAMMNLRMKNLDLEEEAIKYIIDYGKGLITKNDLKNKYDNLGQKVINNHYEIVNTRKKLEKNIDEIINNFINIGILKWEK